MTNCVRYSLHEQWFRFDGPSFTDSPQECARICARYIEQHPFTPPDVLLEACASIYEYYAMTINANSIVWIRRALDNPPEWLSDKDWLLYNWI